MNIAKYFMRIVISEEKKIRKRALFLVPLGQTLAECVKENSTIPSWSVRKSEHGIISRVSHMNAGNTDFNDPVFQGPR